MLFEALVTRKTVTVGEKLVLPYKLAEVCLQTSILGVNFIFYFKNFMSYLFRSGKGSLRWVNEGKVCF